MRNIIIVVLLLVSSISYSQNDSPFVFVRVIECQGGDTANESMILISRGESIEKISLEKFHKNNFEENFKTISATLNSIKEDGYMLISSSGGGGNDNAMILQNYIFIKEEK